MLQKLKKKKLIEGRYPNLFVSDSVAQVTDNRAQYIKNRAFDSDHYEQLILKFIDKYGSANRKDIVDLILDKLPDFLNQDQKHAKIGNLITKMRKNNLIKNQGSSSKSPRWIRN